MRRLVLVKHSMPEIERDKPASAWKLGEVGRRRSELLAARLSEFSPEVIWSSSEPKAIETGQIVADEFSVPVEIADGLEEHHRDNVPFLSKEVFEEAVERFFRCPDRLVLGTETAEQARARFTAAIDKVVDAGQKDSIVVAHGDGHDAVRGEGGRSSANEFVASVGAAVVCRTDATRVAHRVDCRGCHRGGSRGLIEWLLPLTANSEYASMLTQLHHAILHPRDRG